MITYAYDIECLKNFFSATFVNVDDPTDVRVFYVGLGKNDPSDIVDFLKKKMVLVGYNNHYYDDAMLKGLVEYSKGGNLNKKLYELSSKLINDILKDDPDVIKFRWGKKIQYAWSSIDLMRLMAFDKLGISLKQIAINLRWPKIMDMPISHFSEIGDLELDTILEYNLNDVLITKELYHAVTPLRELRRDLSKLYGVNLHSADDSRMANLILEEIYAEEMKMDISSIKKLRTERDKVLLGDCIASFVSFETPQLQELLDRISSTYVYAYNKYKYSETIHFGGCTFKLGVGGLHSEDAPGIFATDEKFLIQDMDVASYYPNLIINNNFYPEHLGKDFIGVLKRITKERLDAKHSGDRVKADGLKITINSIFGKLGSPTFWLFDAKQMLSTTVSGQMGLLMLIEELSLNGIQVISANTDGVVCKIPVELQDKYYEIAKEWEKKTNLELEFTPYKKYVRRDVNSYITEKMDGKTKVKGAFLNEVDLKKAYHMPIVAKALYAYFIKGIPPRKTLEECRDIMDFCLSQKSGSNFSMELHSGSKKQSLQKTNRYFISKKGGALVKKDNVTKKYTSLASGKLVTILNDYDPFNDFASYQVDLLFYEKEIEKIIEKIEPKQFTLFDMTSLGNSNLISRDIDLPEAKEEELNINQINKLGKLQFSKKLESIALNEKTIEGISPRYVYVLDFNPRTMIADVYCLSKGIRQGIFVSKDAYKKEKIEKGQLIYCTRFGKNGYDPAIAEFRITNKLREELNTLL